MSPVVLFFFICLAGLNSVSATTTHLYTYCPNTTFFSSTNSALRSSFNSLLSNLSSSANLSTPAFQYSTVGSPAVYGLYLCRGDDDAATCRDCVAVATADLSKNCPLASKAVAWYDECMIRYSNVSFFAQVDSDTHLPMWSNSNITGNVTHFHEVLSATMADVATMAARGNTTLKFATEEEKFNEFRTVYVLGQCTPDLSQSDCYSCLQVGISYLPFGNSQGGRVLFYSCNLRYEIYPFYKQMILSPAPAPHAPPSTKKPKRNALLIAGSVITAFVLLLIGLALLFRLVQRMKLKSTNTAELSDIMTVEALQMDFNTIRAGTQNFSIDNKLGQGGFGSVYKGKLENGQEIAVKRLSDTSGQGVTEFKTEVTIVAKLQHRNLVKLLGFCVSGKERILVYEFLPNSSLDKFLSDPTKRMSLNWQTRFKIICGIAKGLMYLHEDSRLRVIHRDLKSSNILLDEDLNPKISDFGLAKLFGVDQTQAVTDSVAGTYGYMAPEYILMGHYSIKSDVYSFGIILLEMVSGERNKYTSNSLVKEALLYRAWKLWNEGEGEALKLVDETLDGSYEKDDVIKCVHIGLLCIQENATKRPNMTSVVAALGGQSVTLPLPSPPNFFNYSYTSSIDKTNSVCVISTQDVSIAGTSDTKDLYER